MHVLATGDIGAGLKVRATSLCRRVTPLAVTVVHAVAPHTPLLRVLPTTPTAITLSLAQVGMPQEILHLHHPLPPPVRPTAYIAVQKTLMVKNSTPFQAAAALPLLLSLIILSIPMPKKD